MVGKLYRRIKTVNSHIDAWRISLYAQVRVCTKDPAEGTAAAEGLDAARVAADTHASLAQQRSGSGTGEMLRSNFVVVADLVLGQDGHLLSEDEKASTALFKVGTAILCHISS